MTQPELQSKHDDCSLGLTLLMTCRWEHRHSIVCPMIGNAPWGCGVVFLPWLPAPTEFGLNQHIGEIYTNWICLIHMQLKLKNHQNKVFHYFCSVYRFFSVLYLDCHSYSVHSKTYQWIFVHRFLQGGHAVLTIFPGRALPALTVPWCFKSPFGGGLPSGCHSEEPFKNLKCCHWSVSQKEIEPQFFEVQGTL